MKIGMMSTWNVPCGASVHAKFVGTAWVLSGHKLTVFAPYSTPIIGKQDEPWIIRNYSLSKGSSFDSQPLLDKDYDIFLLQYIPPMPMKQLLHIAPKIKKKAKTVVIIHEGNSPGKELCKFPWDAVVCFDERYKRFLTNVFPEKKIHIITYPCHPVEHGNKVEARKKLFLPQDKMVLFIYGIAVHHHIPLLPTIERVGKGKPLLLLVHTNVQDWFDIYEAIKSRYIFIDLRMGILELNELYTYLHASDALIYHRDSSVDIVVASTIYQCMGAGCPILASDTNFVETLNREVLKYRNLNELQRLLLDPDLKDRLRSTVEAAIKYANHNSAVKIAKKFIQLFKRL